MRLIEIIFCCAIVFTGSIWYSSAGTKKNLKKNSSIKTINLCPEKCILTEEIPECINVQNLRVPVNTSEVCSMFFKNTFNSSLECLERCKNCGPRKMIGRCTKRAIERVYGLCRKPAETGVCRGYFVMYYYDQKTKQCKKFVYGGCGGNRNRFNSELDCLLRCGKLGHLERSQEDDGVIHEEL